jgi:hypothetical protein
MSARLFTPRVILCSAALASFSAGAAFAWLQSAPSAPAPTPARISDTTRESSTPAAVKSSVDEAFGAIASTFGDPDSLRRYADLYSVLEQITPEQIGPLLDRIEHLPKRRREEVKLLVFTHVCIRWPDAATDWLRRQRYWNASRFILNDSYYEYADLMKSWARNAPDQFRARLASREISSTLIEAATALMKNAGDDPRQQLAVLATLPPGRLRDNARDEYLRELAKKNPESAVREAERLAGGPLDINALQSLIGTWIERDPAAALQELQVRLPADASGLWGSWVVNELIGSAAKKEPQLAAAWALELPANLRQPAAISAAREWAAKEPASGLAWALANDISIDIANSPDFFGNHFQPASERSVLAEAALQQPDKTAAWLRSLPADTERERLTHYVLEVVREPTALAKLRAALGR